MEDGRTLAHRAEVIDPAPWMPAEDVDLWLTAEDAQHRLAERQHLRNLYSGGGRGSSDGSHDVLRQLHGVTFVCAHCGGLVDFLVACRAVPPATGCAGPRCSAAYRLPAYAVGQTRMAVALMVGTRGLIAPYERGQQVVTLYGRAYTLRVALSALAVALRPLCGSVAF